MTDTCQECGAAVPAGLAVCEACFRGRGLYRIDEHGEGKPPWDVQRKAQIKQPPGDQTEGLKDRHPTEAMPTEPTKALLSPQWRQEVIGLLRAQQLEITLLIAKLEGMDAHV
jgi:hypothetical protein